MTHKIFRKLLFTLITITSVIYIGIIVNIDSFSYIFYDDAFYYMDLVQTGSVINPTTDGINMTTGYHPLWFFLLEFLSIFGITGIYLPSILTAIVLMISTYNFYFFMKTITRSKPRALIYSVLTHLHLPILLLNFSGMESSLVLLSLSVLLNIIAYCGPSWKDRDCHIDTLLLSAILLFLSRTDMILIILPLFFYIVLSVYLCNFSPILYTFKDRGPVWKWSDFPRMKQYVYWLYGGIISTILLYLLWNYVTAGVFTQSSTTIYSQLRWATVNSFADYSARVIEIVSLAFTYFGNFAINKWIFLGVVVLSWRIVPTYMKYFRIGLLLLILAHCFVRFTFSPWYIMPFYFYFVVGVVTLIEKSMRNIRQLRYLTIPMAIGLFISPLVFGVSHLEINDHWNKAGRQTDQIKAATRLSLSRDDIKMKYPYWIGGFNTGKFGYIRNDVVNLDGLMNLSVLESYDRGEGYQYLIDNEIFFIIDVYYYFDIFNNQIPKDSLELVTLYQVKGDQPTAIYRVKGSPFTRLQALEWFYEK